MKKNKILIFSLFFAFLGLLFCGLNVSATVTTSSDITVQGAQVRTAGTAGIRFVGKVEESYEKTNVTAYGMAIAFGEANVADIEIGGTVNGKNVLNAQVSSLEGTNYYVNLTDIPSTMYGQKVTARAYVIDNGDIIYADAITTRSLGQVTLAVKSSGETSSLIEEIATTLKSDYKNVYTDSNGNIFVGSGAFEINPEKLEEEFIKDWNAKFGTTWTEITYANLQASAIEGTTPLTADDDTDCSGTNFYTFFKTDATTSEKWQWFLNYLLAVAGGKVHPKRQLNAILGDGTSTDTYGSGLYMFKHLSASIANFFNGGSSRDANNDIVFNDITKYSSIETYNTSVYATNPTLVPVGNTIELPSLTAANGYEFAGYLASETTYNDSYTLSSSSVVLEAQYSPVDYTIKYYDGANEITSLASSYNIESSDITLPEYNKNGYAFKGWYTTSSFDAGTEVTEITTGSTGNKEFFAKMEVTSNVAVNATFDLNGGSWTTEELLQNATVLKEAKLTRYLSATSVTGHEASLYAAKDLKYWAYIVLTETFNSGVYEIVQIVDGSANVTATYDLVVTWHPSLQDTTTKDTLDSILKNSATYVGKYVIFEGVPSEASACDITMSVIDPSETTKAITKTYIESENLPTAVKENDTFLGWQSSVDNSVIKVYPTYTTNPGDITYTAVYESTGASTNYVNVNVAFDVNGGSLNSPVNTFTVSYYSNSGVSDNTYLCDTGVSTNNSLRYQNKLLLNYDATLDAYKVVAADGATASTSTLGVTWTHAFANGTASSVNVHTFASVGQYIVVDTTALKNGTAQTAKVYANENSLPSNSSSKTYSEPESLPTPTRSGYTFLGWRNSYDNGLYITWPGYYLNPGQITLTAEWESSSSNAGQIIGEFDTQSWVTSGDKIQLSTTYINSSVSTLNWKSESPSIATVSSSGTVTGVSEGVAIIKVYDSSNSGINFIFYVTVFDEDPSGVLKLLVDSNNANVYTRDNLLIGVVGGSPSEYYTDITGSISKLLFEDYVVHTDFYLSSPSNKSTLNGAGKGGVDFVTLHYAADMPYSANYSLRGGYNLASMNKSYNSNGTSTSWHYGVGNDGVWYCQNTAYGAWHAGTSKSMTWTSSGLTTSQIGTDVYTTDVTLGSDGYFYIKGYKTSVKNTTGYTKLNSLGLAVKLSGSTWDLGGHYYNSSYGYISSTGGNNNSIGIESSVREGSDLWLTWQYSAQLCASLLLQFELPIQRLVGHHFFTGKDCPQPLIANNNEIWYEFVEMVQQQMTYFESYSNYDLLLSTNNSYIASNGRITSQPTYSKCVTYDISYTLNGETKTVTLSSIIPGTTR